ncbi:MAG: D-alanyl-D-alanine carboxypeptidase family protein [Andreesenia angusta]|nr:D-alanyl-D-alanine carboxypeptidase family protein [Andreesenia angusta]
MKRTFTFLLILCLSLNNIVLAAPFESYKGVVAGNLDNDEIVINYNGDNPVPIASTTKIMTYLVIKDLIAEGRGSLDDTLVFDEESLEVEGSKLDLVKGSKVRAETLLESILISSANDSCLVLAKHFGESIPNFVRLMNSKAKELGLEKAIFYTPNGLADTEGNENTMTSEELFTLSSHVIKKYPEILEITSKKELIIKEYDIKLENTNNLLGDVKGVDGLKTGFTDNAGRCLIATGKKSEKSNRILSVIMGAESVEDRDQKTIDIIDSLYNEYSSKILFNKNKTVGKKKINDSKYVEIDLVPKEDVSIFIKDNEEYKSDILIMKNLSYPIKKGDIIGKLIIEYGDTKKEFDLTTNNDISRLKAIQLWFKGFFNSI